jgi:hypothetical protein
MRTRLRGVSRLQTDENDQGLKSIRPRHDRFVGLIDAQQITETQGPFPLPAPRVDSNVPVYDPLGRTTAGERFPI